MNTHEGPPVRWRMPPAREWRVCPLCATALNDRILDGAARRLCPACGFVYWEHPHPAAVAVVLEEGRLLCVRRRFAPEAGGWCLPGGFMEPGETVEVAAAREVREESGLEVEVLQQIGVFGPVIAAVAARPCGGRLEPGYDTLGAEWFPLHSAPELCFPTHRAAVEAWSTGRRP